MKFTKVELEKLNWMIENLSEKGIKSKIVEDGEYYKVGLTIKEDLLICYEEWCDAFSVSPVRKIWGKELSHWHQQFGSNEVEEFIKYILER